MKIVNLLLLILTASACSSTGGRRTFFYYVELESYQGGSVETSITTTRDKVCPLENGVYIDQCHGAGKSMLFKDAKQAIDYSKELAGTYCASGSATKVGYRKKSTYSGSSSVSCSSSSYGTTTCYGGNAIYDTNSIFSYECNPEAELDSEVTEVLSSQPIEEWN